MVVNNGCSMEQLQLRHFAIFDPGGEVIFSCSLCCYMSKMGLLPH